MINDQKDFNMGMKCIKYMIFIINFMFLLTAILLLTLGVAIKAIFLDFNDFIDNHYMSPANLLIAIGIILLLVSIFGCVGAMKESTMLINMYAVLLLFIFILELATACAAFALQGQTNAMLERTMNEAIHMYSDSNKLYIKESVDFMQSTLECCGVKNYTDWEGILDNEYHTDIVLPRSCCISNEAYTRCEPYDTGCHHQLNFIIVQSAVLIATSSTTVCIVQILGAICAFMLAKTIRRTKSIRAARQWQLQQNLGLMIKQYDPEYTQMEKSKKVNEGETYLPNSPSVI